jgi:ABC-2 type transport system ATP-binding protein
VRELFSQYGDDIGDLEVRRATLEDTYIALVQQFETGQAAAAATNAFEGAAG